MSHRQIVRFRFLILLMTSLFLELQLVPSSQAAPSANNTLTDLGKLMDSKGMDAPIEQFANTLAPGILDENTRGMHSLILLGLSEYMIYGEHTKAHCRSLINWMPKIFGQIPALCKLIDRHFARYLHGRFASEAYQRIFTKKFDFTKFKNHLQNLPAKPSVWREIGIAEKSTVLENARRLASIVDTNGGGHSLYSISVLHIFVDILEALGKDNPDDEPDTAEDVDNSGDNHPENSGNNLLYNSGEKRPESSDDEPDTSKDSLVDNSEDNRPENSGDNLPYASESIIPDNSGNNLPAISQDNSPAISQDNLPAISQDNLLAISKDNSPVISKDNSPAVSQDNSPAISDNSPAISQDNLPAISKDNLSAISQDNLPAISQDNLPAIPKGKLKGILPGMVPSLVQKHPKYSFAGGIAGSLLLGGLWNYFKPSSTTEGTIQTGNDTLIPTTFQGEPNSFDWTLLLAVTCFLGGAIAFRYSCTDYCIANAPRNVHQRKGKQMAMKQSKKRSKRSLKLGKASTSSATSISTSSQAREQTST